MAVELPPTSCLPGCVAQHDLGDPGCVVDVDPVPVVDPAGHEPLVLVSVHRAPAGAWLELDVDNHTARVRLDDLLAAVWSAAAALWAVPA